MQKIHALYQLKNMVLRTPFSYGYYRKLKRYRIPSYSPDQNRHPVREKHQVTKGWKQDFEGDFQYRNYSSYQEYITHQSQKFDEILKTAGGFDNKSILEYRKRFYKRFHHITPLLDKTSQILCLGARQGTEVEVLRDMGYRNAMGLDLNPGPENPFVKYGDFMKLDYSDSSVDMIYTNCVDHAFNLDNFFQEHARVVKPGGFALYDIHGFGFGSFESVGWKSEDSVFLLSLKYFTRVLKVEADDPWKWLLIRR